MTKTIYTSRGHAILVDDADYDELSRYNWRVTTWGYAVAKIRGDAVVMHRLLTNAPKGMDVDHINHNKLDNRRSNLRLATRSENLRNRHKIANKTSQFKGVSFCNNRMKWQVVISIPNGQCKFLGYFEDEIEAALAWDAAALQYGDEFSLLNFPREGERSAA